MNEATVLLFIALTVAAAGAAEAEGCGRAGSQRCDADGRHLSVCTSGGAWRRLTDCHASQADCVDGRCVPHQRTNAARADSCTPNQWGCSENCEYQTICTANGIWVEITKCPGSSLCVNGECTNTISICPQADGGMVCQKGSVGHIFPDLKNCTVRHKCETEGSPPKKVEPSCSSEKIYNSCTYDCDGDSKICENYQPCDGDEVLDLVVPGNPSLHYICLNKNIHLFKCPNPDEYYIPEIGLCFSIGSDVCPQTVSTPGAPFQESEWMNE